MTNRDVFFQILSEATGIPEKELFVPVNLPPNMNFRKELTDKEATALLASLRQEMSGILAWYVRQILMAKPPEGEA